MNISVAGLGIVSKMGGTQEIEMRLQSPAINPAEFPASPHLPLDIPNEYGVTEKLVRRMSHFAKLSLLSAVHAIRDSGLDLAGKSVGIIQGSVYGPIISGIQAFDDLIDFGDNQLSPTNFSGSVFNTSATYLTLAFGIQGCTLSQTAGQDTLYTSLLAASLWLETGKADYVIMGIGDEYSAYFDQGQSCQQPGLLPTAEGWTTFILCRSDQAKYGKINFGHMKDPAEVKNKKNVYSVWHEQIEAARHFPDYSKDSQSCFPVYLRGSYPSAAAFDLAFALICAKTGRFAVSRPGDESYQIQSLNKGEKITCRNSAETGGCFYYEIF